MQYVDDSIIHRSCKINQKDTCIKELGKDISSIVKCSVENNLAFSLVKQNLCYLQQNKCRYGRNSKRNILRFAQWHQTRNSEQMETTWYNHWWKPNVEQPYIKNTIKLLFGFEYPKKTQNIHFPVRAQTVSRIVNLFKNRLL